MADYADAPAREAAWLGAADDLPALAASAGGPFQALGAYPRRLSQRGHQCWVWRERVREVRVATGRKRLEHALVATILWAQVTTSAKADVDQAALDAAIALVLTRVRGLPGDKTHGGRFLSVGEDVTVTYTDPLVALVAGDAPGAVGQAYRVDIRYSADDEIAG